jgi:hypothetical protein
VLREFRDEIVEIRGGAGIAPILGKPPAEFLA